MANPRKGGNLTGGKLNRSVVQTSAEKMSLSLVQMGDVVIMRRIDLNLKLLRARRLSPREDRLLDRWARSCGALRDCDECKEIGECQRLADKLIARVKK